MNDNKLRKEKDGNDQARLGKFRIPHKPCVTGSLETTDSQTIEKTLC